MLQSLAQATVDVDKATTDVGTTPVAQQGRADVDKATANVSATPAFVAARADVLQLLVQTKADVDIATTDDG